MTPETAVEEQEFMQVKGLTFDLFESGMVQVRIAVEGQNGDRPQTLLLALTAEQAHKYGKILQEAAALT